MIGGRTTTAAAIAKTSLQPIDRTRFALSELNKRGLVGLSGENYVLYTSGLDLLALRHYADKDLALSLGKVIAKGKESDVYEVLSASSDLYALKFFRLGRTSFRDVRRKRASATSDTHRWVLSNYSAAAREFAALQRLRPITESVPKPIDQDRHTVLLEEVPAVRLATRPEIEDPLGLLLMVLRAERDAYVKAGMIHGDLSEYNILTDGRRVWLIDWPQWVARDHPNALELLSRDTRQVTRFFKRAYNVDAELERAISYVMGESADDRPEAVLRRGLSSASESDQ